MAVVCPHTTEFLCFLKKIIGNDTTFRLFSLPLHADTRSLTPSWCFSSFLKGRWLRRGLGRVEVSYIILKCVYYALSSWWTETWQFQNLIKDYATVDALGMCISTSLYWCGTLRKVGCPIRYRDKCIISAWASKLFVSTWWACQGLSSWSEQWASSRFLFIVLLTDCSTF